MPKIILIICIVLGVICITNLCCNSEKTILSDVMKEDGHVGSLIYTPSRHETSTILIPITYPCGDVTITTLMPIDTTNVVPEYHGVLFECKHGQFVVDSKNLYDNLKKDQNVEICYKEICVERTKGDKKYLQVVGYKFISATPIGIENSKPIEK